MALLERDGRRVRLTPAAHGLVAATDRVLAELDAAEAELAAAHQTVRGELVVGAFPSAAAGLVVPALADLHERHPDLSCTVREHEPEDGVPLLRSGELDLLVSESYDDVPSAPVGGLESHPLLTEPLLLVVPAADRAREPVALTSRRGAPWIAGLAGTQFAAALEHACGSAGFAPRIVHRADDARLIGALVAAGLGIALLPRLACAPAIPTSATSRRRRRAAPPRVGARPPRRHAAARAGRRAHAIQPVTPPASSGGRGRSRPSSRDKARTGAAARRRPLVVRQAVSGPPSPSPSCRAGPPRGSWRRSAGSGRSPSPCGRSCGCS